MIIRPFYRHGIRSDHQSMLWLANKLGEQPRFAEANNEPYDWSDDVVKAGLDLAAQVVSHGAEEEAVLLVGHSQGGLVCRVAAVALVGNLLGKGGEFTQEIRKWQRKRSVKFVKTLGVVTIAAPNAGAITFGQMSVAAELLGRTLAGATDLLDRMCNLKDLTTTRLFEEFENWRVNARYLSISAVCVNRYQRGWAQDVAELLPTRRVAVRWDVPNDGVVEDSSTDLRRSVIRPEVNLAEDYRHVRAYPGSIRLNHSSVRESPEVAKVIVENLEWLTSWWVQ